MLLDFIFIIIVLGPKAVWNTRESYVCVCDGIE